MRRGSQETIGDNIYEIEQKIGEGAYGSVYKAIKKSNQEMVAIKVQSEMNEQERDLMDKMKGKSFQNLISIYDFSRDKNNNYLIVMEFCQQSLYDKLQKGNIPKDEIRFIMKEIGNGIKELHDLGLAHRDLKPENILIQPIKDQVGRIQEKYKLCDFGTAKKIDVLTTQKVGTPYYLAPEQIPTNPYQNQKYDQKVDIWAFGTVIYELLTGQPMFNGYSEQEVWNRIARVTQKEIEDRLNKEIKIERKYKTLLLNMMQIDINKRYSILEALKELRADSVVVQRNQQFNQKKEELNMVQNINQPNLFNLPNPQQLKSQQQQQNNQKANYFNQPSKPLQQNVAELRIPSQIPTSDSSLNQNLNQNLNQGGNLGIEQNNNNKFKPYLSPQPIQNPQQQFNSNQTNNLFRKSILPSQANPQNSQNSQTLQPSNQAFVQQGVNKFSNFGNVQQPAAKQQPIVGQIQNPSNNTDVQQNEKSQTNNQPINVPRQSRVVGNPPSSQFHPNPQPIQPQSQQFQVVNQLGGEKFPNQTKPLVNGQFQIQQQNQDQTQNLIPAKQNPAFRNSQLQGSNIVNPPHQEKQNFSFNNQTDNSINQQQGNQQKVEGNQRIQFKSNIGQLNPSIPNFNPKPSQGNYFPQQQQVQQLNIKNDWKQLPQPSRGRALQQ